jgi:hypothetical protein
VTLLPDREQATSRAWLANHPSVVTAARDRLVAIPEPTSVLDR